MKSAYSIIYLCIGLLFFTISSTATPTPTPRPDSCFLETSYMSGHTGWITCCATGRVFSEGITESPGQGEGIACDIGYGSQDTDPATHPSWQWHNGNAADYMEDFEEYDRWIGGIVVYETGTFDFCFRFSISETPWIYTNCGTAEITSLTPTPTPEVPIPATGTTGLGILIITISALLSMGASQKRK